jgi:hypothetical protein
MYLVCINILKKSQSYHRYPQTTMASLAYANHIDMKDRQQWPLFSCDPIQELCRSVILLVQMEKQDCPLLCKSILFGGRSECRSTLPRFGRSIWRISSGSTVAMIFSSQSYYMESNAIEARLMPASRRIDLCAYSPSGKCNGTCWRLHFEISVLLSHALIIIDLLARSDQDEKI